jgi:hypothetical protein
MAASNGTNRGLVKDRSTVNSTLPPAFGNRRENRVGDPLPHDHRAPAQRASYPRSDEAENIIERFYGPPADEARGATVRFRSMDEQMTVMLPNRIQWKLRISSCPNEVPVPGHEGWSLVTPIGLGRLGGKPVGTFNVGAFDASREIVVTGSVFDTIALWSAGVTHAVGLMGDVDELVQLVVRHRTERIVLALARTPEGERRASELSERLGPVGTVEIVRAIFPNGVGALSYVRDTVSVGDGLARILRHAEWVSGLRRTEATTTALVQPANMAPALPTTDPSNAVHANEPGADSRPSDDEMVVNFGDRRWRIRGIHKTTPEAMKVNALVSREEVGFHVDILDLYSARQRAHFIAMAAVEIGADEHVLKKDLGDLLLKLEERLERRVTASNESNKTPKLTDYEERAARDLLRDPRLLDRILADFDGCGVIGEHDSKLLGYLATVSRKLDRPLAVVIQSSSAAGKSALMQAILAFVPEEERLSFSAMTGQSLFHTGETDLRHKVLSIAEQEGARRATYALKLLQSEGHLTIASTGKDPTTGRLTSHEYRVDGPVALFMTTTAMDVDEELVGRCLVLAVDEGAEQTRAIHTKQRWGQTLDGLFDGREREAIVKLHQDAQRLVLPLAVVNPFADEMTFPDGRLRSRRDHGKLLSLIESLALLHQHQRPVKTAERGGLSIRYVEVTRQDIAVAGRLMAGVLPVNDLPPATGRLLESRRSPARC